MTMTDRPGTGRHLPGAGSAAAAAVDAARGAMLHEAKPRGRTRIGADVVCEALLRQGADVLFGYPGGVVLPLYDVLGDYPELRHVLVRHEQGAAHAADGYARASGRVGVCLGTSGPGATNLVTGIATAQLDSVPMVAITGNVVGAAARQGRLPGDRHHRHHPAHDQAQLPGPRRRRPARASSPRRSTSPAPAGPGPVHVDITKDALQQETRAAHPSPEDVVAGLPGFRPTLEGHPKQLRTAAREIAQAQRPVILAGHGVLHRARPGTSCASCAEQAQIPVAHTLLGIGAIDETHPLRYGFMGMHGWKHVNRAIQSADLLIALGMRFDDRVTGNGQHLRRRTRGSSTSTSTRPRSARTWPSTCPIVGDVEPGPAGADPARARGARRRSARAYFAELAEWRARIGGAPAGTARAPGATGCCRPTTSSSASAS